MAERQLPPYKAEKVQDGFWMIDQQGVRCFLFEGEEDALLVDAGFGGDLRSICEELTDKPIQLIVTHADGDHLGAKDQFDVYMMHPAEFSYYAQRHQEPINAVPVWEGDVLDLGTYQFEVVLLSGHTPGSIGLLEREKRFLIGGDTVQSGPVYMFGNGRNLPAYLAAIRKLQAMGADFDKIYSSHGEVVLDKDILVDIEILADEICQGEWPEPQEAPAHMPETVKTYAKGRAAFYLEK